METLRERIARHEGVRLRPYIDSVGKLTIGVGRNLDDRGITIEEAYHLLDNDIAECTAAVANCLPWTADQPPLIVEVLVECAFQMGIQGLLQFTNTLKCIQYGHYAQAADSMLASKWATQTPSRARELANIIRSHQPPQQ